MPIFMSQGLSPCGGKNEIFAMCLSSHSFDGNHWQPILVSTSVVWAHSHQHKTHIWNTIYPAIQISSNHLRPHASRNGRKRLGSVGRWIAPTNGRIKSQGWYQPSNLETEGSLVVKHCYPPLLQRWTVCCSSCFVRSWHPRQSDKQITLGKWWMVVKKSFCPTWLRLHGMLCINSHAWETKKNVLLKIIFWLLHKDDCQFQVRRDSFLKFVLDAVCHHRKPMGNPEEMVKFDVAFVLL